MSGQLTQNATSAEAPRSRSTSLKAKIRNLILPNKTGLSSSLQRATDSERSREGQIQMCHFVGNKLIKSFVSPYHTVYLTISHLWGTASWRRIPGIPGKVLASESKAKFLANDLRSLVGNDYFWMDILCVDQRDRAARIAMTRHIPTIFRQSIRTILVRDNNGPRECCAELFDQEPLKTSAFETHWSEAHRGEPLADGVLTRLWIFEEIPLSNVVQFVHCNNDRPQKHATDDVERKLMEGVLFPVRLIQFADAWTARCPESIREGMVVAFQKAFLTYGTISRDPPATFDLMPFSFQAHTDSPQRTSKARDFILATMPRTRGYCVPENAKNMTFADLFLDAIRQGIDTKTYTIRPLIPSGLPMRLSEILSDKLPTSLDIPEPWCLGDMVRLCHGRRPQDFRDLLHPSTFSRKPNDTAPIFLLESPNGSDTEIEFRGYRVFPNATLVPSLSSLEIITLIWDTMFHDKYGWLIYFDIALSDVNATITDLSHQPPSLNMSRFMSLPELEAATHTLRLMTLAASSNPPVNDTTLRLINLDVWQRWMDVGFVKAIWIIRLAALFSCGLGVHCYEWSKDKFTPATFEFRGKTLWALIPSTVLRTDTCYEFFLVQADKYSRIKEDEFILLARQQDSPLLYIRCLCSAEYNPNNIDSS